MTKAFVLSFFVLLLLLGAVNAKTKVKVITRVVCRQCGFPIREAPAEGVVVQTRCDLKGEGNGQSNKSGDSVCDVTVDDDDDRVCKTKPKNFPANCSFLTDVNGGLNGLPFSNCTLTKVTGSGKEKVYNCGTFVLTPKPCPSPPPSVQPPARAPSPSTKPPVLPPGKAPVSAPGPETKPPVAAPASSTKSPAPPPSIKPPTKIKVVTKVVCRQCGLPVKEVAINGVIVQTRCGRSEGNGQSNQTGDSVCSMSFDGDDDRICTTKPTGLPATCKFLSNANEGRPFSNCTAVKVGKEIVYNCGIFVFTPKPCSSPPAPTQAPARAPSPSKPAVSAPGPATKPPVSAPKPPVSAPGPSTRSPAPTPIKPPSTSPVPLTKIKVITKIVCRQCGLPQRESPIDGVTVQTSCGKSEGNGRSNKTGDSECSMSFDGDDDRICKTKPTSLPPNCTFLSNSSEGLPFSNCTVIKSGNERVYNCGTFVFTPCPSPPPSVQPPAKAPSPFSRAPAQAPALSTKAPVSAPGPAATKPPSISPNSAPSTSPTSSTKIKVITKVVCRQCGLPLSESPINGVIVQTSCGKSEGSGRSNTTGDSQCSMSFDGDDDRICKTKPTSLPPNCKFLSNANEGLPFFNCTVVKVGNERVYNCGTFVFTPKPCSVAPPSAQPPAKAPTQSPVSAPGPLTKPPASAPRPSAKAPSSVPSSSIKPPVSAPGPSLKPPAAAPSNARSPASAPGPSTKSFGPAPSSKPPVSAPVKSPVSTPAPSTGSPASAPSTRPPTSAPSKSPASSPSAKPPAPGPSAKAPGPAPSTNKAPAPAPSSRPPAPATKSPASAPSPISAVSAPVPSPCI